MRVQVRRVLCTVLAVCLLGFVLPASADGTDIKALQERLISLGYEIGAADGIVGKKDFRSNHVGPDSPAGRRI